MVITGLEVFLAGIDTYKNKRMALIVNQTAVTGTCRYLWEEMRRLGVPPVRIFSPEHGIFGTEQDQAPVGGQTVQGIDVVSLYGSSRDTLVPDERCLEDIDCVVFDIQDVGSRYYTYVNTMALSMKAMSGRGIEFIVLDRPNPLGGEEAEGPSLEDGYGSFVGVFPVPVRHGLTAGELALLYRDMENLDLNITVVMMSGWERGMYYEDTGIPWIPPSPNMPTVTTALVYPGMCLLEGTNVSEGRGTTIPFECSGAPFAEVGALAAMLNGMVLPGVYFRPVEFKPTFNKYHDTTVPGVYLHVTDRKSFRPFLTGVAVTKAYHDLGGDSFSFLHDVYEFNSQHPAFDLLAGGAAIRKAIAGRKGLWALRELWAEDEMLFMKRKKEYHIY
ncbi:MAG TPA: DUF1343 domain-containing protein [Spirochaetota bacterium]|nr:DUF1343 domain-containing protein [Spirochaetota bacterium]